MSIRVRAQPSSDRVFARVVSAAAAVTSRPEELADSLRALYPDVEVVERALSGERRTFYVYRDGGFATDETDEWWRAEDVGYAELDVATGRFRCANEQLLKLLDASEADLVGRHYRELVTEDVHQWVDEMWASVVDLGDVQSEVLLVARPGASRLVEFRAARDDAVVCIHFREAPPKGRRRRPGSQP